MFAQAGGRISYLNEIVTFQFLFLFSLSCGTNLYTTFYNSSQKEKAKRLISKKRFRQQPK